MTKPSLRPSALHRYAEQVRSWINHPRHTKKLRRQVGRWNQLCSSLDTIQQTELAMQAYAANPGFSGSGEHYLALYGLLQAMVLQQDAVCHLDEALGGRGTNIGTDRHLQDIRKIRNVSVGHPTKVDRRDVMSHHQISRPKLGKGFELVSAFDDGRRQFTFVSVSQLMRRQKLSVARMMRTIVQNLDVEIASKTVTLKTKEELVRSRREEVPSRVAKAVVGRASVLQHRSVQHGSVQNRSVQERSAQHRSVQHRSVQPREIGTRDRRVARPDAKPPINDRRRSAVSAYTGDAAQDNGRRGKSAPQKNDRRAVPRVAASQPEQRRRGVPVQTIPSFRRRGLPGNSQGTRSRQIEGSRTVVPLPLHPPTQRVVA